MNFYTMLPNGYGGVFRAPSMSASQSKINNSLILNVLSQTLKKSISNYATVYQHQLKLQTQSLSQSKINEPQKTVEIIDSKTKEDQPSNVQIQQKIDSKNISEKPNTQIESPLKPKENCILNATNDSLSIQVKETQPLKKIITYNIMEKVKNKNKRESKTANLPNVSLIQAACLPTLPFTHQQLKKKKQSLLRRQVTEWHQKMQNRRDKREIRMLNC